MNETQVQELRHQLDQYLCGLITWAELQAYMIRLTTLDNERSETHR